MSDRDLPLVYKRVEGNALCYESARTLHVSVTPLPPDVSRVRTLLRLSAPLVVVLALICLAVLNMAARASWMEMEDGVLWVEERGYAAVASVIAEGSPAARAGIATGDVLMAIDGVPVDSPSQIVSKFHSLKPNDTAYLHDSPAAGCEHDHPAGSCRDSIWPARFVLRACGRRHLLAARRRGGSAAPSREPGNAALLLALRRVLRDPGVLVQRPSSICSTRCSIGAMWWRC